MQEHCLEAAPLLINFWKGYAYWQNKLVEKWPLVFKFIHWGLALCFLLNFYIVEEGDPPHEYIGYAALVLVLLRVFTVFLSKKNSYFKPPNLVQNKFHVKAIHIAIWGLFVLLALTGWMMSWDFFWGNERLEQLHAILSKSLLILIILHLGGVFLDSVRFKRHTWLNMLR